MRTITITANGCHDCPIKWFDEYSQHIGYRCGITNNPCNELDGFANDCPMKEVEGTEPFKPDETCLECKYYYGCRDDCGGFGFEKVAK